MKMENRHMVVRILGGLALLVVILAAAYPTPVTAGVKTSYLYDLSDFTGVIPYQTPRISVDRERKEVSVLYQNTVRVYNENGMEIYRFGDDLDLGRIADLSVDRDGNIRMLSYRWSDTEKRNLFEIVRCNFRGEPRGIISLENLPAEFSSFSPNRMVCRDDTLYFADLPGLKVLTTDSEGHFKGGIDLFPRLGLQDKDRGNVEMWGFSVEDDGSILFTIPVLFKAYRLYPDGKLASFGKPGGAPGKFNITGGIALDRRGNYLVVDKLKCTVMVFDGDSNYLTQFGYRGFKPGNLIAPDDIAMDGDDRVYVTQGGRRGVSVYRVTDE
jgi:hypothetical protein